MSDTNCTKCMSDFVLLAEEIWTHCHYIPFFIIGLRFRFLLQTLLRLITLL
jgi:hypothetical protein